MGSKSRDGEVSGKIRYEHEGAMGMHTILRRWDMQRQALQQSTMSLSVRTSPIDRGVPLTAMHMHPAPEINQHQTAAAEPPA